MTKWLSVALFGSGVWLFAACGSDNSGAGTISDPVSACKEQDKVLCDKIFSCFTKAELDAAKGTVGLNAADCAVRYDAECTPNKKNCAAGETFHADKAQACIDGFKAFNCDDIKSDTTPDPAACDQVCTK